jgi:hypothetical protein
MPIERMRLRALAEIRLQEAEALTKCVRFDYIPANHPEAASVIDYAQAPNERPVIMDGVFWKGFFFEYVLVADYPARSTVTA